MRTKHDDQARHEPSEPGTVAAQRVGVKPYYATTKNTR